MAEPRSNAVLWATVVALGVTQIISWGSLYYAFALLIEPFALATNADRGTVVGAFSVALLAAGLASAPIGKLVDRHGGRSVMSTGSLAGAVLLASLAQVQSVWQLYVDWALIGVAMAATLYDPAFTVLGQLFQERQRKAITVLTLFGGFASTVFWPLTQALSEGHGWRAALYALALLNLLVCVPLHLLLPGRPARPKASDQGAKPAAAMRDPTFYGLCAAFTGNALVFSAMSVHMLSLFQDKGLTPSQAAWVGALIGPMQVLGRLLEFVFLSRWSPSRVGALAMWLLPLSLALLAVQDSGDMGVMVLFALLYGSGNGVMTIVRGAVPAELYGRENYGAVNGAMAMPVLLAKAAGPVAASAAMAAWAGPTNALFLLVATGLVSAGLFSLISRSRWRPLSTLREVPDR